MLGWDLGGMIMVSGGFETISILGSVMHERFSRERWHRHLLKLHDDLKTLSYVLQSNFVHLGDRKSFCLHIGIVDDIAPELHIKVASDARSMTNDVACVSPIEAKAAMPSLPPPTVLFVRHACLRMTSTDALRYT
jgi:hypothetical protein